MAPRKSPSLDRDLIFEMGSTPPRGSRCARGGRGWLLPLLLKVSFARNGVARIALNNRRGDAQLGYTRRNERQAARLRERTFSELRIGAGRIWFAELALELPATCDYYSRALPSVIPELNVENCRRLLIIVAPPTLPPSLLPSLAPSISSDGNDYSLLGRQRRP